MGECMYVWMDIWIDEWMGGWMYGWMGGQMDGWIYEMVAYIDGYTCVQWIILVS